MQDQLADIVWSSLTTGHQHLALIEGGVRKYPADIAPFAAITPAFLQPKPPLACIP